MSADAHPNDYVLDQILDGARAVRDGHFGPQSRDE